MNTLIIYGHPNPKSFNHAILEKAKEVLEKKGDTVTVRDLYAINFDPILKPNDFITFSQGKMPEDIAKEQDFIKKADRFIFIFPIWWGSMPAILKGYFDRVFAHGFAYQYEADGSATPLLADKTAVIINTTGGPKEWYEASLKKGLDITVDQTTFGFCGIKVDKHLYYYSIPSSTEERRKEILKSLENEF